MVIKKAQIKIQQMAFMLIAIMVFFALIGLFMMSARMKNIESKATELQSENALLLVSKLANSPEFSCGNALGKGINCIDSDKVMALKKNIKGYSSFWGVSNIQIMKIYPLQEEIIICEEENYPNCNQINLISDEIKGIAQDNFVILCRKETDDAYPYDKCELAKLMVSYENVE